MNVSLQNLRVCSEYFRIHVVSHLSDEHGDTVHVLEHSDVRGVHVLEHLSLDLNTDMQHVKTTRLTDLKVAIVCFFNYTLRKSLYII